MKLYNRISTVLLAAAAFCGIFSSCVKETAKNADALLVSEEQLTFAAKASEQVLTVYADGDWKADVTDTWFKISATKGSGTVELTVTVDENTGDDSRDGKIVIVGSDIAQKIEVVVYQKQDRFREVAETSLTENAAKAEGALAKVAKCQIMALTTDGFVVSDGSVNLFVQGLNKGLKVGDMITFTGDVATVNDVKAIKLEDSFYESNEQVTYPEAKDITEESAYAPAAVEYVSITGTLAADGKIAVNDVNTAMAYNSSLDLTDYANHKVKLTGYYVGESSKLHAIAPLTVEDLGLVGEVYLQFEIETSAFKAANPDFGTTYQFAASVGDGYIKYVPYDVTATDPNKKFVMDISGNDPRCTGPWPEDYWLFYGNTPIKSHSEVQIKFGARTSATGHKYWLLEYLDGTIWKTAGTPQLSTDLPEGENVYYTAAMNADGATNVTVNETVTLTKNMDHPQFRFRCVANWQASGAGALAARNGGSARLAVKGACQPAIFVLKEGDGVEEKDPEPEYANISCSAKTITFEGTPEAPKSFTLSSDKDFTVKAGAKWFSVDVTEGKAGQEYTVNVTCTNNEASKLRESSIVIKSADTTLEIPVIQSAAGQELEPFISIVKNNTASVLGQGENFTVKVQANVEYAVETSDWITAVPAASSSAMVEVKEYTFKAAANLTGVARTGKVRFYKDGIEAVVTVSQDKFEPNVELSYNTYSVPGAAVNVPVKIVANVPFTISTSDSWIKLPATSGPAGTMDVTVALAANTGAARTGKVTVKNADYNYSKEYTIYQLAAGVVYEDNFDWMRSFIDTYNASVAASKAIGKSVEDNNASGVAPNLYTTASLSSLAAELVKRGYTDLNPTPKVVYPQDCYWKFGKTSAHTGIELPEFAGYTGDAYVSFDWSPHMTGTGAIDKVNVVVEVLDANGNSVSVSTPCTNNWEAKQLAWHNEKIKVSGLKAGYRVAVRPEFMSDHDGVTQMRWYIDNIKVTTE